MDGELDRSTRPGDARRQLLRCLHRRDDDEPLQPGAHPPRPHHWSPHLRVSPSPPESPMTNPRLPIALAVLLLASSCGTEHPPVEPAPAAPTPEGGLSLNGTSVTPGGLSGTDECRSEALTSGS